jgi:formate C-acetyltransferase
LYERGLTNAANGLAAIEACVFGARSIGMPELAAALRDDLADPALHARLCQAPKWGNDDARADRWAAELVAMRERVLDRVDARFGHRPHMVGHVVRSLHHVDGRRLGATPDGRRAGAPLADSIGAETGTAAAGPTGVLNSVLKLDAPRNYKGGYNLNVTLPSGGQDAGTVLALVEGFFGQGGQELQVNVLNAAVLRQAQACPERHGNLLVRVAGLSARFVDLPLVEQEELIRRAEATTTTFTSTSTST